MAGQLVITTGREFTFSAGIMKLHTLWIGLAAAIALLAA